MIITKNCKFYNPDFISAIYIHFPYFGVQRNSKCSSSAQASFGWNAFIGTPTNLNLYMSVTKFTSFRYRISKICYRITSTYSEVTTVSFLPAFLKSWRHLQHECRNILNSLFRLTEFTGRAWKPIHHLNYWSSNTALISFY